MTDDQAEQHFDALSCDDTQQQNRPFYIVLVDIKHAAIHKDILCVEKMLLSKDFKFVALSYRWGELAETIIDTQLGYMASITSFDLTDFYQLCWVMTQEPDMKDMEYVWVDAICVDQTNYKRRKATICQMTNIYEQASYILAVPDLHKCCPYNAHQGNWSAMYSTVQYSETIYHLLHGNADELVDIDEDFLRRQSEDKGFLQTLPEQTHLYSKRNADQWEKVIDEAINGLCKSMRFLEYLVIDWSNRVWVISECNIAKRKNKLKFWFAMLGNARVDRISFFLFDFDRPISIAPNFKNCHVLSNIASLVPQKRGHYVSTYLDFYDTMVGQLDQRTFFEIILNSKASKNEDRIYAILPQSKYKYKMADSQEVDRWKIDNMMSVKLELYEIMNTKDKLLFLFMSGNPRSISRNIIFPAFAATIIHWPIDFFDPPIEIDHGDEDASACNFDLASKSTIMLIPLVTTSSKEEGPCLYKLNIKPKEYYLNVNPQNCAFFNEPPWRKIAIRKRLHLDDPRLPLDVVCIPYSSNSVMKTKNAQQYSYFLPRQIYLFGSFEKNKWTFTRMLDDENIALASDWTHHYCSDEYSLDFDIY